MHSRSFSGLRSILFGLRIGSVVGALLLLGSARPWFVRAQTITTVQPQSGAAGTPVRLYGVEFGATPSDNTVRFGDTSAPVDSVGSGVLYTRVPSGVSGVVSVSVTVGGITSTAAQQFSAVSGGGGRFAALGAGITGVQYGDADLGDVNGDGRLDLVVAGSDGGAPATTLYINQGGGDFTIADAGLLDVTGSSGSGASVTFGDVDNDGDLDLFIAGSDGSFPTATLYLNDGAGNFTAAQAGISGVTNSSVDMGDVNNDGTLDLVLTGLNADNIRTTMLYLNQGGGDFTLADVQLLGVSAGTSTFGDVDSDGDLDLLVTGRSLEDSYSTTLYENDGSGRFSVAETDLPGVSRGSADFGDVDTDGDLELILTGNREGMVGSATLFENDGTGTFTSTSEGITGVALGSSTFGDLDGDGVPDLVLTGRDGASTPTTLLYRNAGDGSFSLHTDSLTAVGFSTSDWGDLDGDGTLDLVVTGDTTGNVEGGGPTATLYQNGGEYVPPAIGVDSSSLDDTLAVDESSTQSVQIENTATDPNAAALQFNAFVTASGEDNTSKTLRATRSGMEWPPSVVAGDETVSLSTPPSKSHSEEPPLFLDDPTEPDTATVDVDRVRMDISGERINVVMEHDQPVDTSNYAFILAFDVDQDTTTGVEYEVVGAELGTGSAFLYDRANGLTVAELPVGVDSSAVHFSVPLSLIDGMPPMNVSGVVGTADYPSDWFPNQGSVPLGSVGWLSLSPASESVAPGESVSMEATFAPGSLSPDTTVHGTIHILSNDPEQDVVGIPVTLRVEGGPVFTARPDSVEMGRTQVGTNSPEVRLVFENTGSGIGTGLTLALDNQVDYEILNDTGEETLAPGSTRTAWVAFHPDEAGPGQTATVTLTSEVDSQATTVLTGTGVDVQVTAQTDGGPASHGEPVGISVTPQGPFEPTTRRLYARRAGDLQYQVQDDSSQIAESLVTKRGVDYYVALREGDLSVVVPGGSEAAAQEDPLHLPVSFDSLTAPYAMRPEAYRMVSVPAQTGEGLRAAFERNYGSYVPSAWRLTRWMPDAGENGAYREYPQIDSLRPGQGMWLITAEEERFVLQEGRSVDASDPWEVVLQPGWNQIGNPFGFSVPWAAVLAATESASGLTAADLDGPVAYRDSGGYRYGEPQLRPWEGYFVHNRTSQADTLLIPPEGAGAEIRRTRGPAVLSTTWNRPESSRPDSTAGHSATSKRTSASEAPYILRASVVRDGERAHQVWLGLRSEAKAGPDALDFAQAPPIGRSVQLSVLGPQSKDRPTRWAGSFKPPEGEGRSWILAVQNRSTVSVQEVQLRLTARGRLPAGQRRYLLDLGQGRRMTAGQSFRVEPRETRRLKVIVGTKAYAEQNSEGIPMEQFENDLRANYPNPFSSETTIEYVLGSEQEVTIQVFNILGQKVRTLADERKKAGRHTVRWKGNNRYGKPLGNGVYFYRIETDEFTETRKMVLVR